MSRWMLLAVGAALGTLGAFSFSQEGDPTKTEIWSPVPPVITAKAHEPPSDAIVLFDGDGLDAWKDPGWKLEDGAVTVVPGTGNLVSKRGFGDVQLHLEWRTPERVEGEGQGRGNSGVFLMERYEVQVLDSYQNSTYVNGQAGSIYKQHIPLVNASRPPGVWQTYDIVFTAPRFAADGSLERAGRMTVFHNGVLIQRDVEILGTTTYIGEPRYEAHGAKAPLMLQEHSNPVSYRNIWVRELISP